MATDTEHRDTGPDAPSRADAKIRDVAKFFGVHRRTVIRWVKQRGLPCYQPGQEYLFDMDEVKRWSRVNGKAAEEQVEKDSEASPKVESEEKEAPAPTPPAPEPYLVPEDQEPVIEATGDPEPEPTTSPLLDQLRRRREEAEREAAERAKALEVDEL